MRGKTIFHKRIRDLSGKQNSGSAISRKEDSINQSQPPDKNIRCKQRRDAEAFLAIHHALLNIIVGAHSPPLARLEEIGVARINLGPRPMRAFLSLLRKIARELLGKGTYEYMTKDTLSYSEVNQWFEEDIICNIRKSQMILFESA